MAGISPRESCMRSDNAWEERNLWTYLLRDAYELSMAARNPYAPAGKNPRSMNRLFDSTALNSVIRGANRLLSELTPVDQQWVGLVPGPLLEMQLSKQQITEVKKQLAPIIAMLALVFNSGKFINAIWEMYIDLLIAGMGCLLVLENPTNDLEPVSITCVSQAQVATEYNAHGDLCGVYRKRPGFKARQIKEMWPDANIPAEIQEMLKKVGKGKTKDPEVDLLEATCFGEGRDQNWYYRVLWRKNGSDPVVLIERPYKTCPWIIMNWSRLPGMSYGPGPVLLALPDIRTANKIVEMLLQNAALALAGMYIARDDGVVNPETMMITPGGIIPVQSTGGALGASIAPLPTSRNFDVGQLVLDDLRTNIRKALFDNALPNDNGTPRSPTEIVERVKELTQDIGGNIGRLTTELVQLVRRVLDILSSRGMVPDVKVDQFNLKVQVNSPLARAQQMSEVQTVVQWLQTVNSLGGPQASMLSAKVEDIYVWIGSKMGVPLELMRSEDERMAMQQQVAQIVASQAAGGIGGQPVAQLQ